MSELHERCLDLFDTDEECAEALHVTVDRFLDIVEGRSKLDPPSIFVWSNILNIPANEAKKYFE